MKDRSDGERREEIAGCRTVVDGAERPCGHDDDAHGPEGCMWCDCGAFT